MAKNGIHAGNCSVSGDRSMGLGVLSGWIRFVRRDPCGCGWVDVFSREGDLAILSRETQTPAAWMDRG